MFANLQTEAELLRQQGVMEVSQIKGFQFGHGVGLTEQEALDSALSEIGQTVYVQVRSEISSIQQTAIKEEGKTPDYTSHFAASTHSFSNIELSGHIIHARVQARDGWYVRVKISQENIVKLRQELQRTAPLIAYLEILLEKNELHPGRQLKYAVRGLKEAKRIGMADQRIAGHSYGGLSYAAYFKMQIQDAVNLMLPLPYMEENQLRVTLIHKQTFAPIAGIWLLVGGQKVVTDKNGLSSPISLPIKSTSITLLALGDQDALEGSSLSIDTLLVDQIELAEITNPETTTVFVHLHPADIEVTLNKYTQTTPTFFNVPSGEPVTLIVEESNQYQSRHYSIKTLGRRYTYLTDTLIERKYGQLTLDFMRPDNNFIIRVENQRGNNIAATSRFDEEVEIGNYSVQISHITRPDDYQSVTDSPILVRENQHVRRSYQKPLNRQPWKKGTAYLLNYGFGSKLGDTYLLPTVNDTETEMIDFKESSCSGGCPGQSFHLKKVNHIDLQAFKLFNTASLAVSGSIGVSIAEFELDKKHEINLWGVGTSIGAGFWTSKLGSLSWVTANYKAEYMHWDDKNNILEQNKMDSYVLNTYPYLEAGTLLGFVSVGVRVPNPNIVAPEFFIGLGLETIQSGYKHSKTIAASRGLHY